MPLFDRAKKEIGEAVDKVDDVVDAVVDKVDDVVDEVREHMPGGDKVADNVPDDAGEKAEAAVRDATNRDDS